MVCVTEVDNCLIKLSSVDPYRLCDEFDLVVSSVVLINTFKSIFYPQLKTVTHEI